MVDVTQCMEAAWLLARGAGAILREKLREPRTVEHKGLIDLVTDADRASERFLIAQLRERFPQDGILTEEAGLVEERRVGFTWVMDPLDGTTNYAHGVPHFNVSLALCPVGPGPAVVGCVYDPMRDEAFLAGQGQGAWLVSHLGHDQVRQPLHTSKRSTLAESLLATGFPYDRAAHADNNLREHEAVLLQCQGVLRPGAAALDLAWTAAGRLDGYWEAHVKPWDVAAGALLVLEAGGCVTGYDGAAFDGRQSAVVCAGAALHAPLRDAVAAARVRAGFPAVPGR